MKYIIILIIAILCTDLAGQSRKADYYQQDTTIVIDGIQGRQYVGTVSDSSLIALISAYSNDLKDSDRARKRQLRELSRDTLKISREIKRNDRLIERVQKRGYQSVVDVGDTDTTPIDSTATTFRRGLQLSFANKAALDRIPKTQLESWAELLSLDATGTKAELSERIWADLVR